MAKSPDVIKIGFDYRASLEQFVKETNGVFDGISEKAGKQRISIQLDAKNDKVIEKIKELQKLKLDKFTFEFGESGLAEQLKTFDQLEKKITEIINLSKGINNIGSGNGIGNSIVDEKSLNSIIDLFGKMESHLGEIKKIFADVGDGEEFSPLLKMINDVQVSIKELSTSVSKIKLDVNMDLGSGVNEERLNQKVSQSMNRQLEAYRNLFAAMKSTGKTNKEMLRFFEPDDASISEIIGAYKGIIKRAEEQFGKDIYKNKIGKDTYSAYIKEIKNATDQFNRATNKKNTENPLGDLFGKNELIEVVSQLGLIADRLSEISSTVSGLGNTFKNVFKEGFNVSASIEEIEKLTSRVKELEDELSKVKVSSTSPVETNILSGNVNVENELKLLQEKKKILSSLQEEYDEEEISEMTQIKSYQEILELVTKIRNLRSDMTATKGKMSGARQINDSNLAKQYEDEASSIRKQISSLEDAMPLLIAFEDLTKQTLTSFKTDDELNKFALELYQCLINLRGELGLINAEDFSKISSEINSLKDSVVKIPEKKKIEIELEYKSMTPDGELAYRGIAGKDGNYLNVSNDDGAVWWTSQKDLSQTRYTRNGTGSEFSGNLKAKNLFEFTSASTNWQKATYLGDGIDELSVKITDLYNRIEVLKSRKEELIKTSQIESQEYKDIAIELGSLEAQYNAISDSKSNMYGTHMPNDWVRIAKQNGYDGLAIRGIDDDTGNIATSYAVWAKEQIENVKLVAESEEEFIKIHNEFLESTSTTPSTSETPIKDVFQGGIEEKSIDTLKAKIKEIFTDTDELKRVLKSLDEGSYFHLDWYKDSELKDFTDVDERIGKLIPLLKEYGYTIKNLNSSSDSLETSGSIVSLADENDKLEKITTSAKDAATSKEKFANANKEVKTSADETAISVDKEISALEKAGNRFESQATGLAIKPDDQHQFSSWKKQLEDLNIKIAEYKRKVENLSKIDIADEEQIKKAKTEIENLGKSIKETITVMSKTSQSERGWTQTGVDKLIQRMNDDLKKNSNYTKETRRNIEGLIEELKNIPDRPLSEVFNDFSRFKREAHDARKEGKAFFEIFKEKVIYGGAAQLAGMVGFYDVINVGREIVTNIKEVDTALTELRKVSDATEQRLTTNFKNSADTAKELGTTVSDVISATADWSRMGYNIDQSEELARVSTLYKNVGDGIDIETANNSLISTLQGFQLDASEAESIIDKFNEVANNYAIDSAGIGEALQRSAASFNAANTDLSKSIALITATRLKKLVEYMETYIKNIFNCHRSLYYYTPQYRGNYYMMV